MEGMLQVLDLFEKPAFSLPIDSLFSLLWFPFCLLDCFEYLRDGDGTDMEILPQVIRIVFLVSSFTLLKSISQYQEDGIIRFNFGICASTMRSDRYLAFIYVVMLLICLITLSCLEVGEEKNKFRFVFSSLERLSLFFFPSSSLL